jgi:hypothetical protein
MAASEKLEAARRTGSLTNVIGALRDEARTETADTGTGTSIREQVDIVDGSLRLAAHLTAQGKTGAERREAMRGVQVGSTVTAQGSAKTTLTRAEKMAQTLAWGLSLSKEARHEFMMSPKFEALSDGGQEIVSQAFGEIDSKSYDDSIGIADEDFNWESSVEIDQLQEDETESVGDSFDVLEGEDIESFDIHDADPWPGDVV